eukprot:gene10019-biopygen8934
MVCMGPHGAPLDPMGPPWDPTRSTWAQKQGKPMLFYAYGRAPGKCNGQGVAATTTPAARPLRGEPSPSDGGLRADSDETTFSSLIGVDAEATPWPPINVCRY